MTVLSILATTSGVVACLSMIPQAHRIFKRKSAKDISIITYSILVTSGLIWVLYGIEIKSIPLILTNALGSMFLMIVIFGWFLYGR
jgi:MtN3 and saliva related transmembrane protein